MIFLPKIYHKFHAVAIRNLQIRLLKKRLVTLPIIKKSYFHSGENLKCKAKGSALYVSGNRAQTVFAVLSPYLDISKTLQKTSELEINLKLRGVNQDVRQLLQSWEELQELELRKKKLEEERTSISGAIKSLTVDKKIDKRELDKLKSQGKEVRESLKVVAKKVLDLEETVVLEYLKLPNKLHSSVETTDKTLMTFFDKPTFQYEARDHEEIGKLCGELEFSNNSPTAYYLLKRLAVMELSCSDYFSDLFQLHGYIQHSNPDFAKGVVVEGSGIHVSEIERVFMLSGSDNDDNVQYLVGGGSLQAFAAYFTKQIIENANCLPQKLVSVGRNYSPSCSEFTGLLNAWQSIVVDSFVLYEHTPSHQEQMLNEVLMVLVQGYVQLGLHFQVRQYAAHTLELHESAAIGILMFSPKTQLYHEVGRISVCGDYISKRLLTLLRVTKDSASFLSMIHVRVCNITRLLAILMENRQTESGSYSIPDCIETRMFM